MSATAPRRRDRIQPAPPPTPDGKVWRSNKAGDTVLMDAEMVQAQAAFRMNFYDSLAPELREQMRARGEQ